MRPYSLWSHMFSLTNRYILYRTQVSWRLLVTHLSYLFCRRRIRTLSRMEQTKPKKQNVKEPIYEQRRISDWHPPRDIAGREVKGKDTIRGWWPREAENRARARYDGRGRTENVCSRLALGRFRFWELRIDSFFLAFFGQGIVNKNRFFNIRNCFRIDSKSHVLGPWPNTLVTDGAGARAPAGCSRDKLKLPLPPAWDETRVSWLIS